MLLFEESVSTLYCSNDGRLRKERERTEVGHVFVLRHYASTSVVDDTHEVVIATSDAVVADAYIAGYDLAAKESR